MIATILSRAGLVLSIAAAVVTLAFFHGGYAPVAWGWTSLLGFWAVILALLLQSTHVVNRTGLALLVSAVALVGWTCLSAGWSLSPPRTMWEVERDLAYVAVVAALLLLWRGKRPTVFLAGIAAGLVATAAFALGRYVLERPNFDATQGYLLFRPIGYANALGGLAVLALPLVLAFAAHTPQRSHKAVASASTIVLTATLYLTQNRSGWLALAVAIVVWLLRTNAPATAAETMLILAPVVGAAIAVLAALGLLDSHSSADDLQARRLAAGAIVLAFGAVAGVLTPRLRGPTLPRRVVIGSARAIGVLTTGALAVSLFDLGDRAHYWRVAWHAFEKHPLLGTGAGTFDEQWFRYRTIGRSVRDAHNLYLETLSELGLVGFVLLAALLIVPILASRGVHDPMLSASLASYCGFLVHAAFEWDWEMPIIVISALSLAAALTLSDDRARAIRVTDGVRYASTAVAAGVAAFCVLALAGNSYLLAAEHRLTAGDVEGAQARATRARTLLPWSSEPWLVLGDGYLQTGQLLRSQAAFRRALAKDQADWTLWLRLAAVSRGRDRLAALHHAVRLNPILLSRLARGA